MTQWQRKERQCSKAAVNSTSKMKKLTSVQRHALSLHSVHHSKAHVKSMREAMEHGKTFKQAHDVAMRKVGD